MLKDIVEAGARREYRLSVRFADGTEGIIDVREPVKFDGVFTPLHDIKYFKRVRVDPGLGTVVWPNGAGLDPDVLYARVAGIDIESELSNPAK